MSKEIIDKGNIIDDYFNNRPFEDHYQLYEERIAAKYIYKITTENQDKVLEFNDFIVNKNKALKKMENNILRYSMQIAMLKQLLVNKLINKIEYFRIKDELMKDYNISSDLTS